MKYTLEVKGNFIYVSGENVEAVYRKRHFKITWYERVSALSHYRQYSTKNFKWKCLDNPSTKSTRELKLVDDFMRKQGCKIL